MEKTSVITETAIEDMVHRFYAKVRQDELIGPIFIHAIGQKWDAHLERLCAFWSTVLLASRSYYGDPFTAHRMVQGIQKDHFERWLFLFKNTVHEVFTEDVAQDIFSRAERMSNRMQDILFEPQTFSFTGQS